MNSPRVDATAFEQFVNEDVYPATVRPDLTLYVLKGDRGECLGKYLFMLEFASIGERDHYWPAEVVASEAVKAYVASWMKQRGTLAQTSGTGATFTEYAVVGQ